MKLRRLLWFCILALLPLTSGCDETRIRTGASALTTLEDDAIRVLVSSDGIGRLAAVANPEGFALSAASIDLELDGAEASLGPLDQVLAVASRRSAPGTSSVSLTTRLNGSTVFVPLRVHVAGETRICRWRLDTTRIETTADLVLVDTDAGPQFGVGGTPMVTLDNPVSRAIDACTGVADLLPENFDALLVAYVRTAISTSAAASLPSSPLDILGLLLGNLQLTHRSTFSNRTGTLIIESDVSRRTDALAITPDGLSIAIDAAAEANRARCAPPSAIEIPPGGGARALDPDAVRRLGADFGVAVSRSWLARVAQGATLAGYTCIGLEDARHPQVNAEVIPTSDLLLEELGLDQIPTGAHATLTLAPGSLPQVDLQPDSATIRVQWANLQVEIYADVFGARTRLARIVADADIRLGPTPQVVGMTKFEIEAIEVATDRIDSDFLAVDPEVEDIDRWMRRTLLSMLQDRFEFPLPFNPAAPVRVISVQVRADDVVAFIRFD